MPEIPFTHYSTEDEQYRFPTLVPGNEKLLRDLMTGVHRGPTEDEFLRARLAALLSGEHKPANEPMSPLGSGFDFNRPFTPMALLNSTGNLYGDPWANMRSGLKEHMTGKKLTP